MVVSLIWILFYTTVKYMILDSFEEQEFFFDYINCSESKLSEGHLDILKWWVGFDLFSIFLDFFSFFFGFGHLYLDVFGNEEIFYFYNPCDFEDCEYLNGNIVSKSNNELIVMDKEVVYYTKAFSLFIIVTVFSIAVYYVSG